MTFYFDNMPTENQIIEAIERQERAIGVTLTPTNKEYAIQTFDMDVYFEDSLETYRAFLIQENQLYKFVAEKC